MNHFETGILYALEATRQNNIRMPDAVSIHPLTVRSILSKLEKPSNDNIEGKHKFCGLDVISDSSVDPDRFILVYKRR